MLSYYHDVSSSQLTESVVVINTQYSTTVVTQYNTAADSVYDTVMTLSLIRSTVLL